MKEVTFLAVILLLFSCVSSTPSAGSRMTKDNYTFSTRSSINENLPPSEGDWEISNKTVYLNDTSVLINGNLTITSGGSLVLTNSILKINSTSDVRYWLNVLGGELFINFSNVTANDQQYGYYFYANGGKVVVNKSNFERFTMGNSYPKTAVWSLDFCAYNSYIGGGLYFVYGNGANHRVENSTVQYVNIDGTSFYFNNCTFLNYMGAYTYGGYALITNSSFPNGYFATYGGVIETINTTYKNPPQVVSQGSGRIVVKNYLSGKVIDSNGASVLNIPITIKNREGSIVSQNLTTLSDGTIPTQALTLFEQNLTATTYSTPHTIIVGNAKPQINISKSQQNITINKDATTDLAILSPPTFSDINPVPTQNITVNATITNIGDSPASDLQVDFYADSTFIGSAKINSINAGGEGKATIDWMSSEGLHSIRAVINGTNEWLLDNNENSESIVVSYGNVFKNRDVVVIESDGWGGGGETETTLTKVISVLEKHNDKFNVTPAISAYVFTGDTPDFQNVRNDNYNNYYFVPIDNSIISNYIAHIENGTFYAGYNGFTHFNKDVWLSALKNNDAIATSAFLSNIINASTDYNIYSEYSNYNATPPMPKAYDEQSKIIQAGIGEFYRLFNFYPNNTVAVNYTWNNITESVWNESGIQYISSTADSGGEKNDYGMRYIRRNLVYNPIGRADLTGGLLSSVDSILSGWSPLVITTPVENYIDSVSDEKTVSQNLEKLDALLTYIEARGNVIYLTSGELGQLYSSGRSLREFGNNTNKTTIVRNYLPAEYRFNVSTSGFQNFTIEAIKLNDNAAVDYTTNGDNLEFSVSEGDYKITITKNDTKNIITTGPPTAVARLNKTSVIAGESIMFDASRSRSGNPDYQLSYVWDFGDGVTDVGDIVIHKYTKEGTYPVTLTVDDGHGGVNTTTINVIISPKTLSSASTWSAIEKLPYGIGPFITKYWMIIIGIIILTVALLIVRRSIKKKKERRKNVWVSGKDLGKKDVVTIERDLLPAKCPHCYRSFNILTSNLPGNTYCPFCGNMSFIKNPLIEEPKLTTIKCPVCKKTSEITTHKKPAQIRCPQCNAPGLVK